MTATCTSAPVPPSDKARAGFSLVEVIVAIVILTTGVLGLAASTMYVVRQTTFAEVTTERASALQSVIEELRATPYASLVDGTNTVGNYEAKWTVVKGARTAEVTIVTLGPGLQSRTSAPPTLAGQVADTFVYRIMEP